MNVINGLALCWLLVCISTISLHAKVGKGMRYEKFSSEINGTVDALVLILKKLSSEEIERLEKRGLVLDTCINENVCIFRNERHCSPGSLKKDFNILEAYPYIRKYNFKPL